MQTIPLYVARIEAPPFLINPTPPALSGNKASLQMAQ